ncbi:MAG: uracil-DNA glycosylase [bacterium]
MGEREKILRLFKRFIEQQLEWGIDEVILQRAPLPDLGEVRGKGDNMSEEVRRRSAKAKQEFLLEGIGEEGPQVEALPMGLTMAEIDEMIKTCKKCPLHEGRTNAVPGTGDVHARLMLVGEAPGYYEDQQGLPFVGRAGQLLTKILKSINLTREEVYITNVVKCRPPENRNPKPEEIRACEPYLVAQINLIQPEVICALGTFAAQALLKTNTPISKLRGEVQYYNGIVLMPTFHPAFLLRNPERKKDVWEDMQKLRDTYHIGR